MNKKLNDDWKQGIGLFNKPVLYCKMEYSSDIQLEILDIIWKYLDLEIEKKEELYFIEDWHHHDGHISKEKKITKRELELMLTKPEKIFRKREYYVYDLVYNTKENFMLRWYCEDEPEDEFYCDFSFTLSDEEKLKNIKKTIQNKCLPEGLKIWNTKEYLDKRYGG